MKSATGRVGKLSDLVTLFLISLVLELILAVPIRQPGTMDSHYYYGSGVSLRENRAFVEPYIWNYLEPPAGLPAPSHLYWMPLPSILVAASQTIFGPTFWAGRLPFILLACCLPLIAYVTSLAISGELRHARTAGLLGLCTGFYLPYWTIPETFAPFAIAGSLSLFLLGRWTKRRNGWTLFAAGILAGFGHLSRADGLLLLATGLLMVIALDYRRPRKMLLACTLLLAGYLLVMAPWYIRDWQASGAILATAGSKTLFLREYDELYSYSTPLTWERYWAWGLGNILQSKLTAGWSNLQSFVAVNNLIFLTPLSVAGLWILRRRRPLWPSILFGISLYGVMTLLFTFPGIRGGLFHSSAALLPAIFAASPVGLDAAVDWVARHRRRWDRQGAQRFFSVGLLILAASLSTLLYYRRVIGAGRWTDPDWNRTDMAMIPVGEWIVREVGDSAVVMVGNPPAFFYHTGLQAVVVPNEGPDQLLEAAHRYSVDMVILDQNRPKPLTLLYQGDQSHPSLVRVWDDTRGAPNGIVVFQVLGH